MDGMEDDNDKPHLKADIRDEKDNIRPGSMLDLIPK